NTARGANLDQIGAVFDDLAHLVLNLLDAVGNAIGGRVILERQEVVVTMSAGNAQGRAADQHAWTRHISRIDGIAQSNVRVSVGGYIANGGEAGIQRHPRIASANERFAWNRDRERLISELRIEREMGVGINHSRHYRGIAQLDPLFTAHQL